jgi:Uma2 family endonuclease
MTTVARTNLTAEEFERQYADVPFCELERGRVLHLTVGGWDHSRICARIVFLLSAWAERTSLGRVLGNEAGLITARGPDTVRGLDAAYFSFQRVARGAEPDGFATTPPDLAVEGVGKGQGFRKMEEKAAEYLGMGVDRVWIVHPKHRFVQVCQVGVEPCRFEETDVLSDERILPAFSVTVAEFFK